MMCEFSTANLGSDSNHCALPQRRGHGKARRGSIPSRAPNPALECARKRDPGMDEGLWKQGRSSHEGVQAPPESLGLSVVDRATR